MGKNNWQIYKFGGSSLNDSDCINRVCNLIKGNSKIGKYLPPVKFPFVFY